MSYADVVPIPVPSAWLLSVMGSMLREETLGDEVKPPPAVPALKDSAGESTEKALSIKDFLAKHLNVTSCAHCQVLLDP